MLWHELALKTARRQLVCRCSMNECRVGAIFYQSKTKKKICFDPPPLFELLTWLHCPWHSGPKMGKLVAEFQCFFLSFLVFLTEKILSPSPQKEIHFSLFLIAFFSYFRTQCLAWWDLKTKMNANLSYTIIISSYSRSFYSLY